MQAIASESRQRQSVEQACASQGYSEHVGHGRAFFAGEQDDAHGIGGEGLFAVFFKKAFFFQFFTALAEGKLQRPLAHG